MTLSFFSKEAFSQGFNETPSHSEFIYRLSCDGRRRAELCCGRQAPGCGGRGLGGFMQRLEPQYGHDDVRRGRMVLLNVASYLNIHEYAAKIDCILVVCCREVNI